VQRRIEVVSGTEEECSAPIANITKKATKAPFTPSKPDARSRQRRHLTAGWHAEHGHVVAVEAAGATGSGVWRMG